VLTLLAAGRSNPEIGQALFISNKTASAHVSNILAQLDVSGREKPRRSRTGSASTALPHARAGRLSSPPADLRRTRSPGRLASRCGAPPLSPTVELIPQRERDHPGEHTRPADRDHPGVARSRRWHPAGGWRATLSPPTQSC